MKTSLLFAGFATLAVGACSSDLVTGGPLLRPGEPTGVIRVQNSSRTSLNVVLISTCSASTYGLNRMVRGESIPQGGHRDFTVSSGCWDVDAGAVGVGEARQRMQVAAGGMTTYTVD